MAAENSVYLHILTCHAHRWLMLEDQSSQALEEVNRRMKARKQKSKRDRKQAEGPKSAKGMLQFMTRKENARGVLAPAPRDQMKQPRRCKRCDQEGHLSSNTRCPKRHKPAAPTRKDTKAAMLAAQ